MRRLPPPESTVPGWRISGLTTAARLTFAAVLLPYFIISAATKFGG
ncbi:MAG: hypothetical protein HOL57_04725 [Marinovum sp.]|jgi:hypothetical protein|nr:hypothetical protein [Marinovum sp.]